MQELPCLSKSARQHGESNDGTDALQQYSVLPVRFYSAANLPPAVAYACVPR